MLFLVDDDDDFGEPPQPASLALPRVSRALALASNFGVCVCVNDPSNRVEDKEEVFP